MMKKLLIISLTFLFTASYAQIELRVHGKTALINGTTITVNEWKGVWHTKDVEVKIDAKSTYTSQKNIKVKKIEISSTAPLSKNAVCWGLCSQQELWNATPILITDLFPMNATQVVTFSGHLYPHMKAGDTKFRYVWFDVNNTNDSTWVDVIFKITNVASVKTLERKDISLQIFPNPASALLNVNLNIKGNSNATNKIEIKDLLGRTVFTKEIKGSVVNTKINTFEFTEGIYFVSVISNNKAIRTEKIVITK